MTYRAKILADHLAPSGYRITTFEVTFPRFVLAEFNTHRVMARNSASSRAIPVEKMLARALTEAVVPVHWGMNQKGMQADQEVSPEAQQEAERIWLEARDLMVGQARKLLDLGVHKQITNRLLEPWLYHTVLCTSTEYENFFALRTHRDAQPEIRKIAVMMAGLYRASAPKFVGDGFWHLPLVDDLDDLMGAGYTLEEIKRISVGRCARVSYLTHDGKRDPKADLDLCERLRASGHMSPFEHVAKALSEPDRSGPFVGWGQYRKQIPGEAIYHPEAP